ncbi:MAG: hypothetical protein GY761_12445, partial [Hyphomicrobiales bacterium]|nr:hypothetical protein [Hyphomicrobiales bacterium]
MSNRDLIERLLKTAPMPGCMAPDGAEPCVGYLDIMDASIAAAAALESHEWQDISTAPKDTAILLLSTGYAIGHFNTKDNRWWTNTDGTGTSEERLLNSWAP